MFAELAIPLFAAMSPVLLIGYVHLWVKTNVNSQELKGLRELFNQRFDDMEDRMERNGIL